MKIRVTVTPDARKESFIAKEGGFVASVREPAQDNRANKRTLVLVARHFKRQVAKVRLVAGHRASKKTFELID